TSRSTLCAHETGRPRMRYTTFFFFSSRRRHTRSKRDWSSDVCSSDLRVLIKITTEFTHQYLLVIMHLQGVHNVCNVKWLRYGKRSEERRVGTESRTPRWRGQRNKEEQGERACSRTQDTVRVQRAD